MASDVLSHSRCLLAFSPCPPPSLPPPNPIAYNITSLPSRYPFPILTCTPRPCPPCWPQVALPLWAPCPPAGPSPPCPTILYIAAYLSPVLTIIGYMLIYVQGAFLVWHGMSQTACLMVSLVTGVGNTEHLRLDRQQLAARPLQVPPHLYTAQFWQYSTDTCELPVGTCAKDFCSR